MEGASKLLLVEILLVDLKGVFEKLIPAILADGKPYLLIDIVFQYLLVHVFHIHEEVVDRTLCFPLTPLDIAVKVREALDLDDVVQASLMEFPFPALALKTADSSTILT
ncbi:MAG: hypothetical protein ACE5GF_01440 [Thermodesulfobacteriota bacterium]